MNWKIYHNPKCSKSRQTLELLQNKGVEFEVIEYLKTPPTINELKAIVQLLGLKPRDIVRTKEETFKTLELDLNNDAAVLDALTQYPILLERPIVVHQNKQARIGRPPENILEMNFNK